MKGDDCRRVCNDGDWRFCNDGEGADACCGGSRMCPFLGMVSAGWFDTMMARTRSCISKLSTDRSWSGFKDPVFEKAAMTSLMAPSSFSPFLSGAMM